MTALVVPLAEALPLLTRARAAAPAGAVPFWGAAALLALRFAARGLLLPGLSPAGYDAWRLGPLETADLEEVRELAAAMPPDAHCVPPDWSPAPGGSPPDEVPDADGPTRLPAPEPLLRAFLDAVADTLPRSPAAPAATGGSAYAARTSRLHPELRDWAAEGRRGARRRSARLAPDRARRGLRTPAFRAVPQMHSLADAALVADAAEVWAGSGPAAAAFPPHARLDARLDALRALRRAARLWPPLAPLLGAAVPDAVDLADEEVSELPGEAAGALAADGVQVHWPRGLARTLTARAVVGRPTAGSAFPDPLAPAAGSLPAPLSPTAGSAFPDRSPPPPRTPSAGATPSVDRAI